MSAEPRCPICDREWEHWRVCDHPACHDGHARKPATSEQIREALAMQTLTRDQIRLAGRVVKVLRLASRPEMDEVAIKLNSGLTGEEEREARIWARAFQLATEDGDCLDLAGRLLEEIDRGALR